MGQARIYASSIVAYEKKDKQTNEKGSRSTIPDAIIGILKFGDIDTPYYRAQSAKKQ